MILFAILLSVSLWAAILGWLVSPWVELYGIVVIVALAIVYAYSSIREEA